MAFAATDDHALSTMSGDRTVKASCLPFAEIPHTTALFKDFLSGSPPVRAFFPRNPYFSEWVKDESALVRYDDARRRRVSDILERQNSFFGSGTKAHENIERLRRGAQAAVTGQQVGLFGGPLFSIFKALTAVKLADEATRAGIDCVPVFWLATEDHDLAEVNHVEFPGTDGKLVRLATTAHSKDDAPVSSVVLDREIESVVAAAAELLGDSEAADLLVEAYKAGETLGTAFGKLFARIFRDWGVILLDAADDELHEVGAPVFEAAIERAAELDQKLLARGKQLEAAGYHQQVKVTPSTTLLFMYRDGVRTPIRRKSNGNGEQDFVVGEAKFSQAELVQLAASRPQDFSANVLLRPILQDHLLPTLVYTGGSAEVAYFAQLGVVYEELAGRVTPIQPRFSATLVEPKITRLLEKYHIDLPALFHGKDVLQEDLARRILPTGLQKAFAEAHSALRNSLASVEHEIEHLDKSLIEAAERSGSKMTYQLNRLRSRAARAEALRNEVIGRHAEQLSNALYPNKVLQEREVGGLYFLGRYGDQLLHDLYSTMHTDCHDHQVITLE
jgi:bacillithiol biosynthesis cysteine-adding enzyme BshC